MKTYDVLIVGGGLTGSSLALMLSRLGLAIALVEAVDPEQRWHSPAGERALALAKGSVEIFDALGIWIKVAKLATPIRYIHVSDRGHFGKTRFDASEMGIDAFGQVVLARDLEQAVASACGEAEIDVLCPAQVTGLRIEPKAAEVCLLQDRRAFSCRARLVVAADGGKSKIRQWVGIGQTVHDYYQTAVVGRVYSEKPHQYAAYERFTDSGPLALLPLQGGNSALIWSHFLEEAKIVQTLPADQFALRLQKAFGWRLGRLKLVSPLCSFPLCLIRAKRLFAERVVLVGNAAHQLHPVAGQGFNLGLRDVVVLTKLMEEYLPRGYDPGAFTLLERYAKMRFPDHDRVIGFSHGLIRCFTPPLKPLALMRSFGLVALDHLPLGKRLLTQHAMGITGSEWLA
nr:2-octaprenyl-6-methoxyphenol hydroxylase [uncultured Gammaproteobacteria bacterium]